MPKPTPEGYEDSLALFSVPARDIAILKKEWVDYFPLNALSENSPIEFNIDANSLRYIDLNKTFLNIQFKITKDDGKPIADKEEVAPVNLALHSFWRQVDLSLNQVPMPSVGTNYPFKSMIDVLLSKGSDAKSTQLQAQMYFKDTAGEMDAAAFAGNKGYNSRQEMISTSRTAELQGNLFLDMAQQNRLLLNSVQINLKFWPSSRPFRLMSSVEEPKYIVEMEQATLKVCQVTVNPDFILGHQEALKHSPALYPFTRSEIKTYNAAKGIKNFRIDNVFNGDIPNRLVVGLVSGEAYSGNYKKNPFNFANYKANSICFYVEGNPTPHKAFTPNFDVDEAGTYSTPYLSLFGDRANEDFGNDIQLEDYPQGYTLYRFDIDKEEHLVKRGTTRLELDFEEALPEVATVIVYGHFPALLRIDESRKVIL